MRILINERLSEHKYKTPEGYLICTDAIIARTGKQEYRKNEIFADSDDDSIIELDRPADEVFSEKTIASFENKPLVNEHPDEDVNTENYKDYAVGFIRDVHKGTVDGQDVLLANLVFTDKEAIEDIESGRKNELSCGYDCDIVDEKNPKQTNIRGNHVALCERGRAGIAKIVDSVSDMALSRTDAMDRCITLGKRFIQHFDKMYHGDKQTANHWLSEMDSWYKQVKQIKLKENNKEILKGDLRDWFFTAGANPQDFMTNPDYEELKAYDEFVEKVLSTNNVKSAYIINDANNSIFYKAYVDGKVYFSDDRDKLEKMNPERIYVLEKDGDIIKDVNPRSGESKEDFISRFMSETKEEYPDEKQRLAVAYSYWKKGKDSMVKDSLTRQERELCDYMLENAYEKGMTAERLWRKMLVYYSEYANLARSKKEDVLDYFEEEIENSMYDSVVEDYNVNVKQNYEPYWNVEVDNDDFELSSTFYTEEQAKKYGEKMKRENHSVKITKVVPVKPVKVKQEKSLASMMGKKFMPHDETPYEKQTTELEKSEERFEDATELSAKSIDDLDEQIKRYQKLHPTWKFGEIRKERGLYRVDVITDSIEDAQTYVIKYKLLEYNTMTKREFKANSVEEALKKFARQIALEGIGTYNVFVGSISPNDGYISLYGRLSKLLDEFNIKWYDSVKDAVEKRVWVQHTRDIDDFINFCEKYNVEVWKSGGFGHYKLKGEQTAIDYVIKNFVGRGEVREADSVKDSKHIKAIKAVKAIKQHQDSKVKDSDRLKQLAYKFAQQANYFDRANSPHSREILSRDDEQKWVEFKRTALEVKKQLEVETKNVKTTTKGDYFGSSGNETIQLLRDANDTLYFKSKDKSDKMAEQLSKQIDNLLTIYSEKIYNPYYGDSDSKVKDVSWDRVQQSKLYTGYSPKIFGKGDKFLLKDAVAKYGKANLYETNKGKFIITNEDRPTLVNCWLDYPQGSYQELGTARKIPDDNKIHTTIFYD